jgi:DNA-binding response OmpR family regulator
VVDDDRRVRDALSRLIRSAGLAVVTFGSANEYLESEKPDAPACLVLDLQLPGIGGLDLQDQLADSGAPPIVFISGHGDIPSTVRAMKAGAVEFLPKPFGDEELLRAIEAAVARDREALAAAVRTGGTADSLRPPQPTRTRSASVRSGWFRQQTGGRRLGNRRKYHCSSSRTDHAKNGVAVACGAGAHGRQAENSSCRRIPMKAHPAKGH